MLHYRKLVTNRVRGLLPGVLFDSDHVLLSGTGNDAVDMTQRKSSMFIKASRMSDEGADETCDQTGHKSGQVSYQLIESKRFIIKRHICRHKLTSNSRHYHATSRHQNNSELSIFWRKLCVTWNQMIFLINRSKKINVWQDSNKAVWQESVLLLFYILMPYLRERFTSISRYNIWLNNHWTATSSWRIRCFHNKPGVVPR